MNASIILICFFGGLITIIVFASVIAAEHTKSKHKRVSSFLGIVVSPLQDKWDQGIYVMERLHTEVSSAISLFELSLDKAEGFLREPDISEILAKFRAEKEKFKSGGRLCLRADLRKAMREIRKFPTINGPLRESIKRIRRVQEAENLIGRCALGIKIIV